MPHCAAVCCCSLCMALPLQVTKPILLEILPSDALAEAALVPTELRFNQAQTRVRTKTYYTQLK